jgi:hypothetical protein
LFDPKLVSQSLANVIRKILNIYQQHKEYRVCAFNWNIWDRNSGRLVWQIRHEELSPKIHLVRGKVYTWFFTYIRVVVPFDDVEADSLQSDGVQVNKLLEGVETGYARCRDLFSKPGCLAKTFLVLVMRHHQNVICILNRSVTESWNSGELKVSGYSGYDVSA